jgi:hypothetical protein
MVGGGGNNFVEFMNCAHTHLGEVGNIKFD